MAANAKFSNCLQPALRRAKADCLGETSSGDGVKRVNEFFSELESAVAVLEDKYNDHCTFANVQCLLPSRGMVARALRKVHLKIIRRLHSRPNLANPWAGEFTIDMPEEIFSCIAKDIMGRTNFGHQLLETNTQTTYKIVDIRKAKYLLRRMDLDRFEVNRDSILKKLLKEPFERCEVIASEEKPLELKFHKTNEVLSVKYYYGYWNKSGVPQH